IVIDAMPGSALIGAHFRPGGAAAFLGSPADIFRDEGVELDALWGGAIRDLRDALIAAPRPADKFHLFEVFLRRRARTDLLNDQPIAHALERLLKQPQTSTIDRVATELGWSHKHLISRFRATVGLLPT